MIRFFRRNNLRFRYIVSFTLIFLVIALFAVIIFYSYQDQNIRETNRSTLDKFTYASNSISTIIRQLDTVANSTALDSILSYDDDNQMYIRFDSSACAMLERLESKLEENIRALFFIRGDKTIYTSQSRELYSLFETEMYNTYNLAMSQFYTRINSITDYELITIKTPEGIPGAIARIIPYPTNGSTKQGMLIFLIPNKILSNEMENYLGYMSGDIYICDKRLNVLYQHLANTGEHIPVLQLKHRRGIGFQEFDAEHVMLSVNQTESGLEFLFCANKKDFYQSIAESLRQFRIYIILLLCLLVILFIVLVVFNYKPINQLVRDITGQKLRHVDGNELNLIQDYYMRTVEEVDNLQNQLSVLSPMVTQQFLNKWVHGQIADRTSFDMLSRYVGITFAYHYYAAVYMLFSTDIIDDDDTFQRLHNQLSNYHLASATFIIGELLEENALYIIVNYGKETDDSKEVYTVTKHICGFLEQHGIKHYHIGVGSVRENPLDMEASLAEAGAAVLYSLKNETKVSFYESRPHDTENTDNTEILSPLTISLLTGAVSRGDKSLAQHTLKEILGQIESRAEAFSYFRFYSAEIVNVLIKVSVSKNLPVEHEQIQPLINYRSKQEFYNNVFKYTDTLCDNIKQRQEIYNIQTKERIMQYILDHYKDSNLSIQSVADAVGIRKTQISSIVKNDYNLNFGQYISYLRLNEFKRLLIETDRKIADIVNEIGYLDVSNFLRKFKMSEGMTAGQYRKQYAYDNPAEKEHQ